MEVPEGNKELLTQQLAIDRPLLRWDRHVEGCPDCLMTGLRMCAEAQCLAEEVRIARLALERGEARARDRAARPAKIPLVSALPRRLRFARVGLRL
jgi:hypothetical protein